MSVLVGEQTRLVVQGITGNEGTFHTLRNADYGTKVVAGVTPGKAGQDVDGIPVFDTVADAVRTTGANTSMIFVPARFAAEAILEAVDAGVDLAVAITEGIPVRDMAEVHAYLEGRDTVLVGPNCPGVISPGLATCSAMNAAARSSSSPPISPTMTMSSVPGSASNRSSASMKPMPWTGSPPIPMQVDCPIPRCVSSWTI